MDPILEVVVPDGEPRTPASLWERPAWVLSLGLYGRAAYEWRRSVALLSLDLLDDPVTMFKMIDQTVADQVRVEVQRWLRTRQDPDLEIPDLPPEFAAPASEQVPAATRAIEIRPCLELVFQPAPTAPSGPMDDGTWPTQNQRDLLATDTWETRPLLEDLHLAAAELAEAIDEHNDDRLRLLEACPNNWLVEPVALLPTEVRVGTQALQRHLHRPVDLYRIFN